MNIWRKLDESGRAWQAVPVSYKFAWFWFVLCAVEFWVILKWIMPHA